MYEKIIDFLKKISSHEGIKIYSENLFFISLEKTVRIAVGFFVGIYVARALTPQYYGLFNYILSFVTVFSILSLPFLNNIAIREMAKSENNCGKILGVLRSIKLSGAAIMIAAIIGSTYLITMDNSTRYLIWLLSIGAFFAGAEYYSSYFVFKRQNKIISLVSLGLFLVVSLFRIYFAYQKFPLRDFIILETFFLLGMVLGLKIIFVKQTNFQLTSDADERKKFLNVAKVLFLAEIFSAIYTKADILILKELVSSHDLGLFTAAVRIIESCSFISIAFGNTFYPSIANSKNVSENLYLYRLKLYIGVVFYINLLCTIALIIFAPLLAKLFGSNYSGVSELIMLYSLKLPFFGVAVPFGQHLYLENRIKYLSLSAFVSMILMISGIIIFTEYFGIRGAALCGVAVQIPVLFLLPWLCGKKELSKIVFSAIIFFPKEIYHKIKTM
ncbi:MAG: oligosaccharide flippase family protein [Lentisphaeria bacterium]|nr:oligosaccharide flippase family protein [Lentisphaeria bacterium]